MLVGQIGYVYRITNTVNGKKYVGCTKLTIALRWARHKSAARRGSSYAIHRAIRKYGHENFILDMLETVEGTHADLMAAEIQQIALHKCIAPLGYNITRGGEGVHLVQEVREKHNKAMRRLYADPAWRMSQIEGARKRSATPEWQNNQAEGSRKRLADPIWKEKHKIGILRVFSDSEYLQSHGAGVRKRSATQEWQEAQIVGAQKRLLDPSWQKENATVLMKAHAASSAKAIARDAHLPPKERTRRARRRELDRLRKAVRRTSPEEALKCREAVKRCLKKKRAAKLALGKS
jgi:group I intron endonuclease